MPQLTSIGKYKIRVFYKTNAYDKEEISSESTYYITISEAPNSPMIKMESAWNIYYSKEDRKNNYLNVSVKLKANKTYE